MLILRRDLQTRTKHSNNEYVNSIFNYIIHNIGRARVDMENIQRENVVYFFDGCLRISSSNSSIIRQRKF